jgi:hypothetical protein
VGAGGRRGRARAGDPHEEAIGSFVDFLPALAPLSKNRDCVVSLRNMKGRARRIGLLPGSFNAPHFGHIELARCATEAADLDHCLFYVNSINLEKRGELAPHAHRCRLLGFMLVGPKMSIVDPEFFSDNPGDAFLPQERVFLALIEALRRGPLANPGDLAGQGIG